MPTILAADIGATNCRFALFRAEPHEPSAPLLALQREVWLKGAEYPGFAEALRALSRPDSGHAFLPEGEARPDMAVMAPAGPVFAVHGGQTCRVSNLPWTVDSCEVQALLGIRDVRLLNDFAAQALACLLPAEVDAVPLFPGLAVANAPCAVLGAGTGFGKALLLHEEPAPGASRGHILRCLATARVLPSEGGHAEFPFIGKKEAALAAFMAEREGTERVIFDDVVSGKGLAHLVSWLTGRALSPPEATALAPALPEAMELYARLYGRACRLFALETLALGGLYITGGMALRLPVLEHPAFAEELRAGAMSGLLSALPVRHVRNDRAGLWGAALFGLLRLAEGG